MSSRALAVRGRARIRESGDFAPRQAVSPDERLAQPEGLRVVANLQFPRLVMYGVAHGVVKLLGIGFLQGTKRMSQHAMRGMRLHPARNVCDQPFCCNSHGNLLCRSSLYSPPPRQAGPFKRSGQPDAI